MFLIFPLILIFSNHLTNINSLQFPINLDVLDYTKILEFLDELPKSECLTELAILAKALSNGEEWAIKMVDASAKPQAGILKGNIFHMGNYDECLELKEKGIQGKYCTSILSPHPKYGKNLADWLSKFLSGFNKEKGEADLMEKARLSYGLCVPKICTAPDLQQISNVLETRAESPLHFNFAEDFCDAGDPRPLTTGAILAIAVFSIFGLILIASTAYDIFLYRHFDDSEKQPTLLVAFSVLTNGKKLFATTSSRDNLNCLNGLRVISMMWVVLDHVFLNTLYEPHVNTVDMLQKWKTAKKNFFIVAGSVAVDTFFTIGGLLVVYLFMKSQSRGAKFSLPIFYLHRILRLTPPLAMVILLKSTLMVYMGGGPLWPVVHSVFQKSCEDNWWMTLTYLQNYFIAYNKQCIGLAWYLAVDTQMYFLSPLLLFPLLKWPKPTLGVISVLVLLSSSYVFAMTWIKNLGTTHLDQDPNTMDLIYFPTHVRGSVYLIGMICGYFVFKTKNCKPLKLRKFQVVGLWICSLGTMFGICFAHSIIVSASEYKVLDAAFFNTFIRIGWSGALSVIILLCVNGYGGAVNYFLSHTIFTVLIRLNYSVYILHWSLMGVIVAQSRAPTYFYNLFLFHQFWGNYIFALGASVIWTLAFESPVIVIEKFIFEKKKKDNLDRRENGTEGKMCVLQVTNKCYTE